MRSLRVVSVPLDHITTRSRPDNGTSVPRPFRPAPRDVRPGEVVREERIVARHRSPSVRRVPFRSPLSAVPALAGAGGVRSVPVPGPVPARIVATVVAGTALAAVGQHALAAALPAVEDGSNMLRVGLDEVFGTAASSTAAAAVLPAQAAAPAVAPVSVEAAVVDATDLLKAADLQRAAAEAAEAARVAEAERLAAEARAAEEARAAAEAAAQAAAASTAGGVQMIVGRVTSEFGLRSGARHNGIDIAAPIGTPIRVPLDGTVIDSGPASGFGQWVRVRHADGTVTVYGHISASLVSVGEEVTAGQQIAKVGNEGVSTGPHLHFEVIPPGGGAINPRSWLDEHDISVT
jgi:murein DD-endopeptidase MepM/ murein hydrolase activator NlpD